METPHTTARATQTEHPWRAVTRTVFQALVALAAMWGLLVEAAGVDDSVGLAAAVTAFMGALARIMALPQVDEFLRRFVPFLAAKP